jgi:hypothetical protein
MKQRHISRHLGRSLFAVVLLGMAAACSEQTMAPAADAPAIVAPANFVKAGDVTVFRVDNSAGATKRIGNHVINIPANAICATAAGYGPAFWDKACTPLRGSVVITATIFKGPSGEPYIDFQPAIRFAPNKEVMLFLRESAGNDRGRPVAVKYCDNLGYCIDESLTDASLKPFRIGTTSVIGRRVKHFSGYVVAYEGECTGTVRSIGDGTYMCEDGGFMRRSGYMVASGKDVIDVMNEDEKSGRKEDEM